MILNVVICSFQPYSKCDMVAEDKRFQLALVIIIIFFPG